MDRVSQHRDYFPILLGLGDENRVGRIGLRSSDVPEVRTNYSRQLEQLVGVETKAPAFFPVELLSSSEQGQERRFIVAEDARVLPFDRQIVLNFPSGKGFSCDLEREGGFRASDRNARPFATSRKCGKDLRRKNLFLRTFTPKPRPNRLKRGLRIRRD